MRLLLGRLFPRLFPKFARMAKQGGTGPRGQAVSPYATLKQPQLITFMAMDF